MSILSKTKKKQQFALLCVIWTNFPFVPTSPLPQNTTHKGKAENGARISFINSAPCYNWLLYFNQMSLLLSVPDAKKLVFQPFWPLWTANTPQICHTHTHTQTDTSTQPILAGNPRAVFKRLVKPCLSAVLRAWQESTSLGLCSSVAHTHIHTPTNTHTSPPISTSAGSPDLGQNNKSATRGFTPIKLQSNDEKT